jgi:hypothetical protein
MASPRIPPAPAPRKVSLLSCFFWWEVFVRLLLLWVERGSGWSL